MILSFYDPLSDFSILYIKVLATYLNQTLLNELSNSIDRISQKKFD